jgi:predicted DNA-binding transcriptional regulator YafY
METIQILKKAIGTGEAIKIRYNGGSQPGTVREIVPKRIMVNENKLRAYCLTAKIEKSLFLNKIEIVEKEAKINYKLNPTLTFNEPKKKWEEIWNANKHKFENANVRFEFKNDSIMLYEKNKKGEEQINPTVTVRYYEPDDDTKPYPYPYLIDARGMGYLNVENIEQVSTIFFICCENAIARVPE